MVLDGKLLSNQIINNLKEFYIQYPTDKRMVIISVGDDYGSKVYCNMKKKTAEKIGIKCDIFHCQKANQEDLEQLITLLSRDKKVAGIMIQHPLPSNLRERALLDRIPYEKDIDGLSTASMGRILTNTQKFVPATALGIIQLLRYYNINLTGKRVLVVGRSEIVGLPLSNMLIKENATVEVAHSKTENLKDIIKDFDVVIAAIGKPEFLKSEWFREGQVLIDAGYNSGNVGDIDHLAYEKASYYTPVPGGVGPMTVASLMLQLHQAIQSMEKCQGLRYVKSKLITKLAEQKKNTNDTQIEIKQSNYLGNYYEERRAEKIAKDWLDFFAGKDVEAGFDAATFDDKK